MLLFENRFFGKNVYMFTSL